MSQQILCRNAPNISTPGSTPQIPQREAGAWHTPCIRWQTYNLLVDKVWCWRSFSSTTKSMEVLRKVSGSDLTFNLCLIAMLGTNVPPSLFLLCADACHVSRRLLGMSLNGAMVNVFLADCYVFRNKGETHSVSVRARRQYTHACWSQHLPSIYIIFTVYIYIY